MAWMRCKGAQMKKEEHGGGEIIAVVVVIAIVIVLAVAFQDNIITLFNNLWDGIFTEGHSVQFGTTEAPEKALS